MSIFKKQPAKKETKEKVIGIEKKNTIMIVDDDENHLKSLELLLAEAYHIITSKNGQEALDNIKELEYPGKISVIITDQRMPKLTGTQLFEEISRIIPDTSRVLITAFKDAPTIIYPYELVMKPFNPEDFITIVKRAVEDYECRQQEIEEKHILKKKVNELSKDLQQSYVRTWASLR